MSRVRDWLDFLDGPLGVNFTLAPEEAMAYFAGKGLRPTFNWQEMLAEDHGKAFTIAKMMDTDMLADVHASLLDAMATGKPFRQWADEITPLLQARGWWGRQRVVDPVTGQVIVAELGTPGRLQTIYRTNLQTAYAAGAWAQIESQAEVAPFLLYDAVDDHRTRPEHAAWDGQVHPVDSAFWKAHYPPNGWNCRCGVIQLSADDLEAMGLSVSPPVKPQTYTWRDPRTGKAVKVPKGLDPGWNYNPGAEYAKHLADLAVKKAKALPAPLPAAALKGLEAAEELAAQTAPLAFDTSTPAGRWHAKAWDAAPAWVRPVLMREQAVEVLPPEDGGAWARAGREIQMSRHDLNTAHGQDVWRHEFGHIIDYRLGRAAAAHGMELVRGMRSSAPDFTSAMNADAKALKAVHSPSGKGAAEKSLALSLRYEEVRDAVVELDGAAARERYLQGKAQALGFTLEGLRGAFKANSAALFDGLAGDVRMARMLVALEERDAERFLFELVGRDADAEGPFGNSYNPVYWKAVRESWKAGVAGSLSDLIGASTRNRVASVKRGFSGHTEGYYRERPGSGQQSEAWANLNALASAPQPEWWAIVERLTPGMARIFREIMGNG